MKITKTQLVETIKKEITRLKKIELAESRLSLLNKELKMLKEDFRENLDEDFDDDDDFDDDEPYYEPNSQGEVNMMEDPSVDKQYLKSQTAALIKKLQVFADSEIIGWDKEEDYEKLGGNENMHQFTFRFGERLKNILNDPLTYKIY